MIIERKDFKIYLFHCFQQWLEQQRYQMYSQDGIFSCKTCNNAVSNNYFVFYIIKIVTILILVKKNTVMFIPASLYAGFPMIMMLLGPTI